MPPCLPSLHCLVAGPGEEAEEWQQLWISGGACAGMEQQEYFQLVADSFGAYDPAVSVHPKLGCVSAAQGHAGIIHEGVSSLHCWSRPPGHSLDA